ncbi:hypothetical protein SOMG_05027 [Schizosaccharomyces osmophilus]|uniref:Uncharacterized protein n=1 Tax=Schizosaccharomyces osmophilus TaxID=2545709 RepID=A0AAE9WG71_9SCHI|nr:uncharacterized protein SOMG_05027 [Schizosaccharomyces osmophilus]WBW75069.1 hypothetical protein SOMG_05027 [Schizosaccharomyces osmophilus]
MPHSSKYISMQELFYILGENESEHLDSLSPSCRKTRLRIRKYKPPKFKTINMKKELPHSKLSMLRVKEKRPNEGRILMGMKDERIAK